MRKICFSLIFAMLHFLSFAQEKASAADTAIINVTEQVKKIFPRHRTDTSYSVVHYGYDDLGRVILQVYEYPQTIWFLYYEYDANGNRTRYISVPWLYNAQKNTWGSPVSKKDVSEFEVLFARMPELMGQK